MRNLGLLVAAGVMLAAAAVAGPVGPYVYSVDRNGKTDWVLGTTLFVNELDTGPTASKQATCPAGATRIKFEPGVTGDFRTKANGSGVPATPPVTDGSGWDNNPAELLMINVPVSGTAITAYAVWSATPSNTVPYKCYGN